VSTQPQPLPEPTPTRPSSPRAWILAVRPKTLGASIVPVAVGSAVAKIEGEFQPAIAFACLAAALLLQVAANLINDVIDFLKGIDTEVRRGPRRVTQHGLIPAPTVLRAAGLATALAACVGAYLVWSGGLPILVIGITAILAAAAYSAGPFPLASHGLGELAAFVFFGVIAVTGTTYLHTGCFSSCAFLASLPVAALVTNLMVVNNLRDIESDRAVGKRTLAVRVGERATRAGYGGLLGLAYAGPLLLWVEEPTRLGIFLPWLSLPLAASLGLGIVRARESEAFERALAGTARLHLVYGALLVAGLLW
jgi:1,4-dihydroxy-2-naphthoate octaprenyltransferase